MKTRVKEYVERLFRKPDTIQSKYAYRVVNKDGVSAYVVAGDNIVMKATKLSYDEFEYHLENNECFRVLEVFTTQKGNRFIYCNDFETDEDFIIKEQKGE